jgi:hypothetical protein
MHQRCALLACLIVLAVPTRAFASDPTPLAGVVLIAGSVVLLVGAGLAALHRFIAIALGILGFVPIGYGTMLSLVYFGTKARIGSLVFLAAVLIFLAAVFWRIHRDYWADSQ